MSRRVVIAVLTFAALLFSTVVVAPVEAAQQREVGGTSAEPLCAPRAGFDVVMENRDLGFTDDETPRYRTWLDDEKLIEAAEPLGELLDREGSLYGVVMDHEKQSFVVVYNPDMSDEDLKALSERVIAVTAGNLTTELVPGCHGMSEVEKITEEIARSGETEEVEAGAMLVSYRFDLGRVEVQMNDDAERSDGGYGDTLRARYSDSLVVVRGGSPGLTSGSRHNDSSPHWGGAGLNKWGIGASCSSGFTFNYGSTSRRAMITAGHCHQFIFGSSNWTYSGSQGFGYHLGRSEPCSWPGCVDVMVIGAGWPQKYENKLHVDPCCPSTRTVTGWRTPRSWYNICVSGQLTKAKCGLSLTASWISTLGLPLGGPPYTSYLKDVFIAEHPSNVVFVQGDSGGPVYIKKNSSEARVIGMGVANTGGSKGVIFHAPTTLMNQVGSLTGVNATVAITNGASTTW